MAEWPRYVPDDRAPRRSDYDSEGGYIGYKRDLREWMDRSLGSDDPINREDLYLPPVPASPASVLDPQITPRPGIYRPPIPGEAQGEVAAIEAPDQAQASAQYDTQGRMPGFGLPGHGMFAPTTPFGVRGIGNVFGAGRYANPYFSPPQYAFPQYAQPQYAPPQYAPPQYSPWSGPNYAPPPMNTGISSISPERFPAMGGKAGASQMRSPYGGGFGSPYGGGFGYSPPPAYSAPAPLFGGKAGRNRVTATPSPWGSGGGRSGFQGGGQFSTAFEGLVPGSGGGMDDTVPASIEGIEPILVSRDEYVIPADTVSDLGDGSTGRGAEVLDGLVTRTRLAKNGSANQPGRIADIGSGPIGLYQNRGKVTPPKSLVESLLESLAKARENARLGDFRLRGDRIAGRASTVLPLRGNPLELGVRGSLGRGGAGLTGLDATYRMPKDRFIKGQYQPREKSWGIKFGGRFNQGGLIV